jgi:hypothetical protein
MSNDWIDELVKNSDYDTRLAITAGCANTFSIMQKTADLIAI